MCLYAIGPPSQLVWNNYYLGNNLHSNIDLDVYIQKNIIIIVIVSVNLARMGCCILYVKKTLHLFILMLAF
jgi:hypothetical protein